MTDRRQDAPEEAKKVIHAAREEAKILLSDASNTARRLLDSAAKINVQGNDLGVISTDIKYIQEDVKEIKLKLENKYVSKEEFDPIKRVVYGLITVLGMATMGAVLKLILIP